MTDSAHFLSLLRQGVVTHKEAYETFGINLPRIKRELAAQHHIIAKVYRRTGAEYELSRDAGDQQELGAA